MMMMSVTRDHHWTSRRSALAREEGLTLIEVAAALVILSLISLYFLSYFTNSAAQSKLSNQHLSATHLANARLHEIQAMPFDQLQNYAIPGHSLPNEEREIYSIHAKISTTYPDYPSHSDFLYIIVTVNWSKDPDLPGEYKHQVSLVGAARRDFAPAGGEHT